MSSVEWTLDDNMVSSMLSNPPWTTPLYSEYANSLNPDFVNAVAIGFTAVLAVFAVFQSVQMFANNRVKDTDNATIRYSFGSSFKVKSCGIAQWFKLSAVLLQGLILAFIAIYNRQLSAGIASLCILVVFLPLHVVEPTRSIVQLASPLLFWSGHLLLTLVSTVQDSCPSSHKILNSSHSTLSQTFQIVSLINSALILLLQVYAWQPTIELVDYYHLNDWSFETAHNIFSDLTYSFIQPVISKAYHADKLDLDSVPPIPKRLSADVASATFGRNWQLAMSNASKSKTNTFSLRRLFTRLIVWKQPKPQSPPRPSLYGALFRSFGWTICQAILFCFLETGFQFVQPFVLRQLIRFFTEYSSADPDFKPPLIKGYFYAVVMFLVATSRYLSLNQAFKYEYSVSFSIDSALTSLVYNKAMRFSSSAKARKNTGAIINNITSDVRNIQSFLESIQNYLAAPIAMVLILICLHSVIGKAVWGALTAAAVTIPIAVGINASFGSIFETWNNVHDDRVSLTNEILTTIKSIKLYSWEKPMLERLSEVRNDRELATQKRIGILSSFGMFIWSCIPFFISVAAFSTFAYIYDIPLTPDIVFPALSFFDLLTLPIFLLPSCIVSLIQASKSITRLTDLLLLEESKDQIVRKPAGKAQGDISACIKNATFIWQKRNSDEDEEAQTSKDNEPSNPSVSDEEALLADATSSTESQSTVALSISDFTAKRGQLTCIVGKVGSGKSTLIRALLGEMEMLEDGKGYIELNGTTAYASQSPWILNATVQENILFGFKYDKEFYRKTIGACQLLPDFETLPDADKTTVGEKGVSLSGGQKARIALARAVYSRSDVYILDDVLSAVDAHVGEQLVKQVLGKKGLLSHKTIILATNNVPVLHQAHEIVLLSEGRIIEKGDFETVMEKGAALSSLIKEFGKSDKEEEPAASSTEVKGSAEDIESSQGSADSDDVVDSIHELAEHIEENIEQVANVSGLQPLAKSLTNDTIGAASVASLNHVYDIDESIKDGVAAPSRKTGATTEDSATGRVKLSAVWEYLEAMNYKMIFFYLIFVAATSVCNLMVKVVLTKWSELNTQAGRNVNTKYYLGLYATFGMSAGLFLLFGSFVIWTFCIIRGSKEFHDRLATSVLRSPMSFFETTPVGRILNRFTQDIGAIDQRIPWVLIFTVTLILNAIVTFGVIVVNVHFMLVVILILGVFYNFVRAYYIPASRELQRLASSAKSPIITSIQESLNGVETITAYRQLDRFAFKSMNSINKHIGAKNALQCCSRWLSVRLNGLSSIILLLTAVSAVGTLSGSNPISAALLGFIINYALSVSSLLNSIIRQWADLETQTVTIERVIEYINLKPEAEMVIEDSRPPSLWPEEGAIKFVNYSTRYRENLDPVLKKVNLDIHGQEKIGIVGRTGAGKSTLTLALFRIIEPTEGHIEIDGINTSKLGLYDLRRHLSIIPQDSQTIIGTVRQNLDPFNQFDDEKLWKALELAHLKDHVETMKTEPTEKEKERAKSSGKELSIGAKLEAKISENGGNLSGGQKQLLCLARALLSTSKVLILDEATASVDVQTDKILQETIKSQFADRTIITIAHRLETVLNSDRVVVLEKGEVAEFDSPDNLLKDKDSLFYGLCKRGGVLEESS